MVDISPVSGAKLETLTDIFPIVETMITVSKGITLNGSLKPVEGEAPMFTSLEIFQTANSVARHSAQQQAVIARNIAHSDTPGFKAMTLPDPAHNSHANVSPGGLKISRSNHIQNSPLFSSTQLQLEPRGSTSPNGNSVSVEIETLKSIEAERNHSRAITVYQSALNIIRSSIGRGR
ncbi:FlgB family protein [uncultured Litoreibacter sp.]|uniref:FlgB family protein n=1 Tax=uncultured Litoreibacter sp. TaxID=1392394 RepID=UPI00260A8909|nr:FlgB family protein [uncultured Litoreibacter sp.]